jgi:hypothetical protein
MLAALTLLALSPWDAPAMPPGRFEPHVVQRCTEDDARASKIASSHASVPVPVPPRGDEVRPPKVRRGAPPEASIAAGVTMIAVGTALRFPAPVYMEIRPDADPWREPTARAGYTSYTHSSRQIGLGAAGTVFQAIGVGLLRRGVAGVRAR